MSLAQLLRNLELSFLLRNLNYLEKVIHYNFSKNTDKSLSYLLGVGDDLSFDISYYLRNTILATRYYDSQLYLSKSIIADYTKTIDFGEKTRTGTEIMEYADSIYRNAVDKVFILNSIITERYTDAPIKILGDSIFLRDYKSINKPMDPLALEAYEAHELRSLYSEIHAGTHRNKIWLIKEMQAKQNHKPGINTSETFESVNGKASSGIFKNDVLFTGGIWEAGIEIEEDTLIKPKERSVYTEDLIIIGTNTAEIVIDESTSYGMPSRVLDILSEDNRVDKEDIQLSSNDTSINIGKPISKSNLENTYETIDNESKGASISSSESVATEDKSMNTFDQYLYIGTGGKGVDCDNNSMFIGKPSGGVADETNFLADTSDKRIFGYSNESVGQPSKRVGWSEQIGDVEKANYGIWWHEEVLPISNSEKAISEQELQIPISKTELGIYTQDETLNISKFSSGTTYDNTVVNLHHMIRQLADVDANVFFMQKNNVEVVGSDGGFIKKDSKAIYDNENMFLERESVHGIYSTKNIFLIKDSNSIEANTPLYLKKDTRGVLGEEAFYFGSKVSRYLSLNTPMNVYRSCRFGLFTDEGISAYKKTGNTSITDDSQTLHKGIYDGHGLDEFERLSKKEYGLYDVEQSESIYKKSTDILINDNNFNVSKSISDTGLQHEYTHVSKSLIDTNTPYAIDLISKAYRDTQIQETSKWIIVPYRMIDSIDTSVGIIPDEYSIENDLEIGITPRYRDVAIEELMLNFKNYYYFSYNEDAFAYRQMNANTRIHDIELAKHNHINETDINDHIDAHRTIYNGYIETSEDSFAYTEKLDYALIKGTDSRVDELLLPPTDFNYSKFAKDLMDGDGQIKQRYIKRYDESTSNPIVNLPIENPIKYFSDLAIHYLDLNVDILTYIIEKAYNIWQSNIYVYSAMSSNGALNDILIKLKDGLFIQYPSEKDQEQLHRAIRLFRWYSEMSILNNADYMLKLNYRDLIVDYANKDIKEFSKISSITNMHIDNSYVLSPIDPKEPSNILIEFDRSHKTILSFDLAVSGGNCVVVINDNELSYSNNFVKINEELPVGANKITITFEPAASPLFNIMQLAIKQYAIKSYKVSYIGKIGETNPTVNHLITMLSVCGDSIDDIQRTVAHATPTAQALEQLRVYFNLHHQDKLKGKRLTTKN